MFPGRGTQFGLLSILGLTLTVALIVRFTIGDGSRANYLDVFLAVWFSLLAVYFFLRGWHLIRGIRKGSPQWESVRRRRGEMEELVKSKREKTGSHDADSEPPEQVPPSS